MADFGQALQWMKEGKKVQRKKWGGEYLKIEDSQIFDECGKIFNRFDSNIILNDDWEIYTEPMSEEAKAALINFTERLLNDFLTAGHYRGDYIKKRIVEVLNEMGVHRD